MGKGIVATEADVGRRVRAGGASGAVLYGRIVDHKGCDCGRPCCYVQYVNGRKPVATWQGMLEWADEELI